MSAQRFSYTPIPPFSGGMPVLNVRLTHDASSVITPALVDSGAAMNLLPFEYGEELGCIWNEQHLALPMGGLLPEAKAFAVPVTLILDPFPPIELAFAWTDVSHTRLRVFASCWGTSISFSTSKSPLQPTNTPLRLLPNRHNHGMKERITLTNDGL